MIANVGNLDRAVRLVLGVALIAVALLSGWAIFDEVALKYGTIVLGIVMMATATIRFCPLYTVLRVNTCRN